MKPFRRADRLRSGLPIQGSKANSLGLRLPDGLLPVAIIFFISVGRLAYFAWQPSAWGVEESLALAFAMGAGYLLTRYIGRSAASGASETWR